MERNKAKINSLQAKTPNSRTRSPKLDLQLKSTGKLLFDPKKDKFIYPLPLKNYNDLREECQSPRILVVLLVPEYPSHWLVTSNEMLIAKKCAYWVSLHGASQSKNTTNHTVYIPKNNIFSPQDLWNLMVLSSRGEAIPYEE